MNGQSNHNPSSNKKPEAPVVLILAGTSTQYTAARQLLGLVPREAVWLTRPSTLQGLKRPKVYRYGTWRALAHIEALKEALLAVEADISDLPE